MLNTYNFITTKSLKMKVIKVTYTVQSAFAQQNKENIKTFIQDLKRINDPGLRYHVYQTTDGKTFMHFAEYTNDQAQKTLLELPSFKSFQQQRDQQLELEPIIEAMQFVDATYSLFN
jgi:quinol monooxygenase YgiN